MGLVVSVLALSVVHGSLLTETPVSFRRARFIDAQLGLVLGAGGCLKDIECKGERICVEGRCVDPAPVSTPQPSVSPPPLPTAEPTTDAQILNLYRDGKVVEARQAAERAKLLVLSQKLAALDETYNDAAAARDAHRVGEAIEKFERMLVLDRELTPEANKYTRAAHRALSKLYADRATSESPPDARASLAKALEHNDANETAASWLQMLNDARAQNRVPDWPPPDATHAQDDVFVRRGMLRDSQSKAEYDRISARLLEQEERLRIRSLQEEKDRLLAIRPSATPGLVGMAVNGALAVLWVALTATGVFAPTLGWTLFGVNVAAFVACVIIAAVAAGKAADIDGRIREINRRMGIALVPSFDASLALTTPRFEPTRF